MRASTPRRGGCATWSGPPPSCSARTARGSIWRGRRTTSWRRRARAPSPTPRRGRPAPGYLSVGVPPPATAALVRALAVGDAYEAQLGVGACQVVVDATEDVARVREIATGLGGHAWVADGPGALREDPWGPPPDGLDVMRRLKAAFDPAGVLSPGIGVGRI